MSHPVCAGVERFHGVTHCVPETPATSCTCTVRVSESHWSRRCGMCFMYHTSYYSNVHSYSFWLHWLWILNALLLYSIAHCSFQTFINSKNLQWWCGWWWWYSNNNNTSNRTYEATWCRPTKSLRCFDLADAQCYISTTDLLWIDLLKLLPHRQNRTMFLFVKEYPTW